MLLKVRKFKNEEDILIGIIQHMILNYSGEKLNLIAHFTLTLVIYQHGIVN